MTPPPQAPSTRHGEPAHEPRSVPERSTAGLATLEWLLVIAAAGGFAAAMAVGLGGIIDDATVASDDADARLIDAGIAAARISDNAIDALIALENSADDPERETAARARLDTLSGQCKTLESAYPGVVGSADWAWLAVPVEMAPQDGSPVLTAGRWACQIGHSTP